MNAAPMVIAEDLWFAYSGGGEALRGVDLVLHPGTLTALIGQNGSGKSTLAKLMVGLLQPQRGQVRMDGQDLRGRSVRELAVRAGYVFQNPDHQLFSPTVGQELALGPRNLELPPSDVDARVERAARQFGLLEWLDRRIGTLSYGQRKTLSIAAVAALEPALLVLDEPTAGLHWQAAGRLMDWLAEHTRAGGGVLLITHDMRLAAEFADRVALLSRGRIEVVGEPYQVFQADEMLQRARIHPPQIVRLARRLQLPASVVTVAAACEAYGAGNG